MRTDRVVRRKTSKKLKKSNRSKRSKRSTPKRVSRTKRVKRSKRSLRSLRTKRTKRSRRMRGGADDETEEVGGGKTAAGEDGGATATPGSGNKALAAVKSTASAVKSTASAVRRRFGSDEAKARIQEKARADHEIYQSRARTDGLSPREQALMDEAKAKLKTEGEGPTKRQVEAMKEREAREAEMEEERVRRYGTDAGIEYADQQIKAKIAMGEARDRRDRREMEDMVRREQRKQRAMDGPEPSHSSRFAR